MTVTCILCKKFAITGIHIRSFHKFPSDGVLRQKWISALGLSKVPKTATVCSDHFDEKSFHQTDGYTRVRRLLANAVPSTWKKAIPCAEEKGLSTIQVDENITRACGGIGCHNLAVHSLGLVISPTNNCPIVFVCTCERNENFNIVHTKSSMLLSMHTAGTCQRSMRINENSSMYNAGSEDNSNRKSLSAETNLEVPYKKTKEEQGSGKGCSKIMVSWMVM
ncbi:unnamed protein product [Arctia plantaginis]|uniref:THAP-type domain-containing protein n=1 Tax=Arctia plantaginis TaxID=874455 RepID=A0A8S1A8R3_ARCPL|nr:unnamed protein product [Arctia plantaginis]